ncbi:MAG TPA: peptide ABC transporter substrate-binding protein [Chloroflexota bacterium]|jgi:ABC-type transport system substrate-binding protein|nr:peptide ABC transporter substrate-binding protein [Chloroflexota bacterium]
MKPRRYPLTALTGVTLGALVIVAGCGTGGQGAAAPGGHAKTLPVLRWYGLAGTSTWANTLDPSQVTDSISNNIVGMVNAGLVKLLPNGSPVPDLASGWSVSPNRMTYTFTLRPGLRFNNGDRLTARDVAWSIERTLSPAAHSPVALAYLGHIAGAAGFNAGTTSTLAGVRVQGRRTIQFRLDEPIAFFLKTLTYPTADVLDPRIVREHPVQTYLTNNCAANVGAGPFRFTCRPGSGLASFYPTGTTPSMKLVPNRYYYGAKPRIRVSMTAVPDVQTNYKLFQAGGIDVTAIPTAAVALNRTKHGFYQFPTSVVDYLTPNEQSAPFNNLHCRLALAYAINRDAINRQILRGTQQSTYAVVPRGMLGYYAGQNNPHYNPAAARRELALCPGGLHNVTLTYQHTSVDIDSEYTAIQNMFQAVGIGVRLAPLTFNSWLGVVGTSLSSTNHQLTENLWIEDYPDPYDYMTLLLRSGQNYDIGGFGNAAYNRLVDQAATEPHVALRAKLYREAQHIALSQGAWISIGNANGYALVNPKISGFVGSEAFGILVPKNNNWANIHIR